MCGGCKNEPAGWRECLVTPDMAAAGASVLGDRSFGESLAEIATDVFYAMQGKAQATTKDSASRIRPA